MDNLYLYGPPGAGKSTLGRRLAADLDRTFLDLDDAIRAEAGMSVPAIFAAEGETGFRARERRALAAAAARTGSVVALGGGALLDPAARALAESSGQVLFLDCATDTLLARVKGAPGTRPLVSGGADAFADLLRRRAAHYASFPLRIDVSTGTPDALLARAETQVGRFRITSGDVPSDILVGNGIRDVLTARARGLGRRALVVCDSNTGPLYAAGVADALAAAGVVPAVHTLVAGEPNKTLVAVQSIWDAFLRHGMDRGDFAVAVGGGVTGDLTGFAAATWMRGIPWVNVPTTLLSMVDASTGGKTGCDLPGAKNMVGAFHSPALVLADVATLRTLPAREWRCGLAEAIKHAIIGDPGLVRLLPSVADPSAADTATLTAFVARALAVKVHVVRDDPHEKGVRAKLNLGHTVGHALEMATDFALEHGEAVAIGTVEEARLAVRLGLAPADWPECVAALFASVGLPVTCPDGLDFKALVPWMARDKKKAGDRIRFALPRALGSVELVPVSLGDVS